MIFLNDLAEIPKLRARERSWKQVPIQWKTFFGRHFRLALRLLAVWSCLLNSSAQSQDSSNEISKDEKLLSKVSFLRAWYVGNSKSPRVTICNTLAGGDPKVLGSHMRPGHLGGYRLFKPGTHYLVVWPGQVVPDESGKISTEEKPLLPAKELEMKPGAYTTVILRENAGQFSCEVLADSLPLPDNGSVFRVFDFSDLKDGFITATGKGGKTTLWQSKDGSQFQKSLSNLQGPCLFELYYLRDGEPVCFNSYETEITSGHSYSIILYFDRYRQRVFGMCEDAQSEVSSAEINEFLKK